jgi:hypothetical protein
VEVTGPHGNTYEHGSAGGVAAGPNGVVGGRARGSAFYRP